MSTTDVGELTAEQQDRRRRLIDAAFELGAEGGYDAVQMRDVAVTANVALATIYRYFSSKDHLLAAAMTEWTARLQSRVAQSPPRGDSAADQMVDVLQRALQGDGAPTEAERGAGAGPFVGRRGGGGELLAGAAADRVDGQRHPRRAPARCGPTSSPCSGTSGTPRSVSWANGRRDFASVHEELERACRVLIQPYEARGSKANGKR